MAAILAEVKAAAVSLTPAEQLELIDMLELAALDSPAAIRAEWSALASKRLEEHESGRRKALPFNSVFQRLSVE